MTPADLADLISRILSSPPRVPMRFDDLVWAITIWHPDVDPCAIDIASRPYQRGEPGAYTYELPALPLEERQ